MREPLKKVAAAAIGIFASLALLVALEGALRLNRAYGWIELPPRQYVSGGQQQPSENWNGVDKKNLAEIPDKFEHLRQIYGEEMFSRQTTAGYTRPDPKGNYRFFKKAPGGEAVYDILYRYNDKQRRPTPGQPPNAATSIFVIGCSYALGEGVEENETIAAFMQSGLRRTAVETLAFHGWSISNHLSALRKEAFPADRPNPYEKLESRPVIMVYLFVPDHVTRATCPLSCYRSENQWMQGLPNYEQSPEGEIKYRGPFRESRPLAFVYKLIANSAIWQQWGLPFSRQEPSLQQFFGVLEAYRRELGAKVPIKDFYFVPIERYYPFDDRVGELARERGFKVLDLGKTALAEMIGRNPRIPFDGHFSAPANYILARLILAQVQRDNPDAK